MPHPHPLDTLRKDNHGIDLELIEYNLSLTPAARLAQHDRWTRFTRQLRAGDDTIDGPLFEILTRLHNHLIPFVITSDSAASVHGCFDVVMALTLCVPLNRATVRRIGEALDGTNPRFRTSSDSRILTPDDDRLRNLKNLYLRTDLGQVDFVRDVPGVGGFDCVRAASTPKQCGEVVCRVLNPNALIDSENAAGHARREYLIDDLRRLVRERCS